MKIAFVSDDETTISRHFGRAKKYVVFSVQEGELTGLEVFSKKNQCSSHRYHHHHDENGRGFGKQSRRKHHEAIETIKDCDVVVSRGMGSGIYGALLDKGIKPIITEISNINPAMEAVLDGTIINHAEQLH